MIERSITCHYANSPQTSIIRLVHAIQQQRVFLCKRKDSTAARRAESELGRNSHHYFGFLILSCEGWGFNWKSVGRFDHRPVFLDRLHSLKPQSKGGTIGSEWTAIETAQHSL